MKTFIKIFFIFAIICSFFGSHVSHGRTLDDTDLKNLKQIEGASIKASGFKSADGTIVGSVNKTALSILTTVKVIFGGALIIFVVYIGIQMMLSLGSDEEELTRAKTSLRYACVGLVFINIPGTLYNIFRTTQPITLDGRTGYTSWLRTPGSTDTNLFIDVFNFGETLNTDIIGFIEIIIGTLAVFIIIISALRIMYSGGKEEDITTHKNKITWSLIGLFFIGFIESWKHFVFGGNIKDGANLFGNIAELTLFFAGPTAIFFLTLAGYYYISSQGDEEKIKKAKAIVVNTVIATVILLASYTFLKDLQDITVPIL